MKRRSLALWTVLSALGLTAAASRTHPFTFPAEAVVVGGFVWLGALFVVERRHGALESDPGLQRAPAPAFRQERWSTVRWAPWAVALVAALVWELVCYVGAPRSAHPTLSSLLDVVDGHPLGHGLVFLAWLWLGWALVRP